MLCPIINIPGPLDNGYTYFRPRCLKYVDRDPARQIGHTKFCSVDTESLCVRSYIRDTMAVEAFKHAMVEAYSVFEKGIQENDRVKLMSIYHDDCTVLPPGRDICGKQSLYDSYRLLSTRLSLI